MQVSTYLKHHWCERKDSGMKNPVLSAYQLQCFIDKVRHERGLDLGNYEYDFLHRRILAAMLDQNIGTFEEYLVVLGRDPAEYKKLFSQLYINKTEFFRDPEVWAFFREGMLRPLLREKVQGAGEKRIRVWSAGCASGEEPYSIAMALAKEMGRMKGWEIQILATDMNENALAQAHRGVYAKERLLNVPEEFLPFFHSLGNDLHQVDEEIRGLVWFQKEDLLTLSSTLPAYLDFIFCRNVMIYFTSGMQDRLKEEFARLLQPCGYLLLGSSEVMLGLQRTSFTQISDEYKIYQKKYQALEREGCSYG